MGYGFGSLSRRISHASEELNSSTTRTEPALYSLGVTTAKHMQHNDWSLDTWTRALQQEEPHSPELEEALSKQWSPSTANNQLVNLKIKKGNFYSGFLFFYFIELNTANSPDVGDTS